MDEILVLDPNYFLPFYDVLDVYDSFIWTERYSAWGDFEIYTPMTKQVYDLLLPDRFLQIKDSKNLMIIESRQIISDPVNGDKLIVKGRSLESILERRCAVSFAPDYGFFSTIMNYLIHDNFIMPTDTNREVEGLIIKTPDHPIFEELLITKQVSITDTVYKAIKDACDRFNFGFKISFNTERITFPDIKFIFEFYLGTDRSYDQPVLPPVIFSKEYDNIINSNHLHDKSPYKNTAYVLGAGEGSDRQLVIVGSTVSGLNRREIFTDASDLPKEVEGVPIPDLEYIDMLEQRGEEELAKNSSINTFEAEVDPVSNIFVYGIDYGLGDIVEVEDDYGNSGAARVTEVIRTKDSTGLTIIPVFTMIE